MGLLPSLQWYSQPLRYSTPDWSRFGVMFSSCIRLDPVCVSIRGHLLIFTDVSVIGPPRGLLLLALLDGYCYWPSWMVIVIGPPRGLLLLTLLEGYCY